MQEAGKSHAGQLQNVTHPKGRATVTQHIPLVPQGGGQHRVVMEDRAGQPGLNVPRLACTTPTSEMA